MPTHLNVSREASDSVRVYYQGSLVLGHFYRSDLKLLRLVPAAFHAGVYILIGPFGIRYVGQASRHLYDRLEAHSRDPDKRWWSEAVFITDASNGLGKNKLDYMERLLITDFLASFCLDNDTKGNVSQIDLVAEQEAGELLSDAFRLAYLVADLHCFRKRRDDARPSRLLEEGVLRYESTLKAVEAAE